MPDQEETRLLAALKDCRWLSLVAADKLTRPMHRVIYGGGAHRKLVEADTIARVNYKAALIALTTYRTAENSRVSGRGA